MLLQQALEEGIEPKKGLIDSPEKKKRNGNSTIVIEPEMSNLTDEQPSTSAQPNERDQSPEIMRPSNQLRELLMSKRKKAHKQSKYRKILPKTNSVPTMLRIVSDLRSNNDDVRRVG